MLILPATVDVITALIAQADAAPEELTLIINVMSAPPLPFLPVEMHGKLIVVMMVYTGAVEEGQHVIAPFRALASPYADMIRPLGYHEMHPPEDSEDHPIAVTSGLYLNRVDDTLPPGPFWTISRRRMHRCGSPNSAYWAAPLPAYRPMPPPTRIDNHGF